jgi:hypothetical protein
MTRLVTIGLPAGLTLVLLLADSGASAGSLYRCVTDREGTIYTDNPAQLEQCTPMTASGAVTSLATVSSGGPPIGALPDPPPVTPAPPEPTVAILPPDSSPSTIAVAPPSAAPDALPCPVGLNPLNPFGAPPCSTADTAPSATITMPSAPDALPGFPTQP